MNPVAKRIPSKQSIVAFTMSGPTVRVGGFLLRELADKSLWLENEIGEGMQVQPEKLEPCLRRFHKKTFDDMNCDKCAKPSDELPWYHVSYNDTIQAFCSRRCLVEFIAPELSKVAVVKQWIPTPEEESRMSQ